MKVLVFPADSYGCGYHRLIWPVEVLRAQGHDVRVVPQEDRQLEVQMEGDRVHGVKLAEEYDVVVLQRVTHRNLVGVIKVLRARGVAVIVDVDDDLSTIHPSNPAWPMLHPTFPKEGSAALHSWRNLDAACREATLVTATTPALVTRYATHGRGRVLPNYLASHYFEDNGHADSSVIGWPASLGSHPNDPDALGNAIARVIDDGGRFHVVSTSPGVERAFGIRDASRVSQVDRGITLSEWPREVAKIGIGIAPLADTKFNHSKSWLKPLELAAVGVPWVGSPRTEYQRLHELGCGVLCDKPSDWYKKLTALRKSVVWRTELSQAGQDVARQLRLDDHAWKWWEAWSDALAVQRREHATLTAR